MNLILAVAVKSTIPKSLFRDFQKEFSQTLKTSTFDGVNCSLVTRYNELDAETERRMKNFVWARLPINA